MGHRKKAGLWSWVKRGFMLTQISPGASALLSVRAQTLSHSQMKSQTQKVGEKGGVVGFVPGEKRGLSQATVH